ncbi:hypothetical protein BKI52_15935 [marine bacterium AO1-C]|nr:hypothetical protein BKI52_15935 [marine bacterium AO1-C]
MAIGSTQHLKKHLKSHKGIFYPLCKISNTNPLQSSVQVYGWKPPNITHSARAERERIRRLPRGKGQLS